MAGKPVRKLPKEKHIRFEEQEKIAEGASDRPSLDAMFNAFLRMTVISKTKN